MKKVLKFALLPVLAICMLCALSACAKPELKEVAGTYEMTSISGNISGTSLNKGMYEYFTLILKDNGDATVKSKGTSGVSTEQSGTYTYSDGKIKLTTKNNGISVTEEYDYVDGVITYSVNSSGIYMTVVFERVDKVDEAADDKPSVYKEVAGTYEMTSISGSINGISINKNMYEYFTLILNDNGNGTVKSKAAGGASYEQSGTYTYADGKIRMTTRSGGASVTEEYDYADGVITYSVNSGGMYMTVVFERVDKGE